MPTTNRLTRLPNAESAGMSVQPLATMPIWRSPPMPSAHARLQSCVAVQYARDKSARRTNLFNQDGLPALIFRAGE